MNRRSWTLGALVVGVATCFAGAAAAQDCDPQTYDRTCDGSTLNLCDATNNMELSFDCQMFSNAPAPLNDHTCGIPPCVGDETGCTMIAEQCVGNEGAACSFELAGNGNPFVLCAADLGCVFEVDADAMNPREVCKPTADCGHPDPHAGCAGNIATYCIGNSNLDVTNQEANGYDCGAYGGTCAMEDGVGPVCHGPVGALCDDVTLFPASVFRCGPGFVCEGANAQDYGTCQPEPVVIMDAGSDPGQDAGGTDEPMGCGGRLVNVHPGGAATGLAGLLIASIPLVRRRRRLPS